MQGVVRIAVIDAAVRAERAGHDVDTDAAQSPVGIVAGEWVGAVRDVARAEAAVPGIERDVEYVRASAPRRDTRNGEWLRCLNPSPGLCTAIEFAEPNAPAGVYEDGASQLTFEPDPR